MKLKDLGNVSDLLCELWDFFTTNSDSDETGLVESVAEKHRAVQKIIRDEFFKIHLKNELAKIRKTYKTK